MGQALAKSQGEDWRPRVLIVDDSPAQRHLLFIYISRLGYEVQAVSSAEEGLEICQNQSIDVVISDWMMPGMNGVEFCKQFRGLSRDGYGYFILLTSNSDRAAVALGLDAGADDFVTKPVTADELRGRLRPALRIISMQSELIQKNQEVEKALGLQRQLNQIIERDLIEARKLQLALMPDRMRSFGPLDIAMLIRPSGHVGGDLIGCLPLDEGRVAAYSIDVSGHGVASAMMTARLAGYFSAAAGERTIAWKHGPKGYEIRAPAEVASAFNSLMLNEIRAEQYFTMVYVEVTLASGALRFVQAGHPHPFILRKDGTLEKIGKGGLPIGLLEDAEYHNEYVTLNQGDRLLVGSDGMSECPNPQGVELGEDGLKAMLIQLARSPSTQLLDLLIEGLIKHGGSENFPDDVSGLILEYRG